MNKHRKKLILDRVRKRGSSPSPTVKKKKKCPQCGKMYANLDKHMKKCDNKVTFE